jgi:hypothetical protein
MRKGWGNQKKRDREAAKMQWREEKLRRKAERHAVIVRFGEDLERRFQ